MKNRHLNKGIKIDGSLIGDSGKNDIGKLSHASIRSNKEEYDMSEYKARYNVEAFVWTGDRDQEEDPEWIIKAIEDHIVWFEPGDKGTNMSIENDPEHNVEIAEPGDYVVKREDGFIFALNKSTFEKLYSRVDPYEKIIDLGQEQVERDVHERNN